MARTDTMTPERFNERDAVRRAAERTGYTGTLHGDEVVNDVTGEACRTVTEFENGTEVDRYVTMTRSAR